MGGPQDRSRAARILGLNGDGIEMEVAGPDAWHAGRAWRRDLRIIGRIRSRIGIRRPDR